MSLPCPALDIAEKEGATGNAASTTGSDRRDLEALRSAESLLRNWARWAWWPDELIGPVGAGCCSAEHEWRSPQCWYPLPPRTKAPNGPDGLMIENIVRDIRPLILRRVLRVWYVEADFRVTMCGLPTFDRLSWSSAMVGIGERTFEKLLQNGRLLVRDLARGG